MAKMLLVTGWIVTYAYIVEAVHRLVRRRPRTRCTRSSSTGRSGTYAFVYWAVIFCNCVAVQALWSGAIRDEPARASSSSSCSSRSGCGASASCSSSRRSTATSCLRAGASTSRAGSTGPSSAGRSRSSCSFPPLPPLRPVHPDLRAQGDAPRPSSAEEARELARPRGAARRGAPCVAARRRVRIGRTRSSERSRALRGRSASRRPASRGRPYPVRASWRALPESLVAVDHARRGRSRARRSRYLVQWWCNARDYPHRRRRSPAQLDPGVHPDRVRVGGARGVARGVRRDPRALPASRASTTRSSSSTASSARRSTASGSRRRRRRRPDVRRPRRAAELERLGRRCAASASGARREGRGARRGLRGASARRSRAAARTRRSSRPTRTSSACSTSRRRSAYEATPLLPGGMAMQHAARGTLPAERAGRPRRGRSTRSSRTVSKRPSASRSPWTAPLLETGRARFDVLLRDVPRRPRRRRQRRGRPDGAAQADQPRDAERRGPPARLGVLHGRGTGYGLMPSYAVQLSVRDDVGGRRVRAARCSSRGTRRRPTCRRTSAPQLARRPR